MTFDDATRAQVTAARPDASTWLGANAGSGKTRVLTDRVARLLLNDTQPQRILCLTYTKAAASEMQNRLFKRLGAWAMLDNDSLRDALMELGIEGAFDEARLRKARTLFAMAIETPGGLKIQTIHSFCASLLRRFPLESGVSPQFTEIEERAAELLRAEILDQMAEGEDASIVAEIARHHTDESLDGLAQAIVGMRDDFASPAQLKDFLEALDLPRDVTRESIMAKTMLGSEDSLIHGLIPRLLASSTNDIKVGKRLQALGAVCWDSLPELEDLFVYGPKTKTAPLRAKVGKVPTQGLQKTLGPQLNDLNAFMHRLEAARPMRLGLIASERSVALHAFAAAFLERYETAKNTRGWLDFDDLITKARALLIDKEVAAWVLYRIDGGIDHILVDEAQDTSRPQWEVIEALADEFHSGEGARDALDRTLFVVGDKKQSIYSFQGADPQEFDRKRALFEQKFTDAGKPFQRQSLAYSFRSSSAILRLVDTVFDPRRRHDFGKDTEHLAFKTTLPGRVDLWPLIEQEAQPDTPKWTDPVDRPSPARPNAVLAEKIADTIKKLTDPNNPSFIPEDGPGPNTPIKRAIRPGDFLILVQRRSDLFAEIIRACKAANLPIAGADRLKVGGELAVKDIAALLSFLATPDDDLSLACVLKSPLFDWDEQMLFKLAHYRTKKHLWEALRGQASTYPETVSVLTDLRAQVDFLRPYDLIERILTKHDGRRKLITRLGAEAEDGINALLTQALAFERNDVPSLTGFIEWMRTDDLEIKRQIDSASDQIRVMTVHGAKGLEAPIVILPETQKRDVRLRSAIVGVGGKPFWKPKSEHIPGPMQPTLDALKDAERAERLRLLYVAITRAEKWLIVAAAGNLSKDKSDWYQIIQEAMGHANAVAVDDDGCLRLQEGDWDNLETIPTAQAATKTNPLDPVFTQSQPLFCHPQDVLSPSDLGGAKALPDPLGQDSETARAFGSMVHGLLEQLAPLSMAQRRDMVRNIEADESGPRIRAALAEVQRVLTSDHLLPLPNAVTLLEVPVTATIRGMRLHGVIDRLVICDNAIQLIDYKTNRVVPASADDCPEGLLRQMGAYQEILEAIYPAHQITACLLWTADATLMPLPNKLIASALDRSPYLDASGGRS